MVSSTDPRLPPIEDDGFTPPPVRKTSSAPWKPRGSRLGVRNKEPGYRYKWASDASGTGDRISELREDGWEIVSGVSGAKVRAGEDNTTSVHKVGTLRLMKLPEEMALAREDYYQDQTDKQTMRPAARAQAMLEATGGPYAADHVITEEVINPRTGKPFESREDARRFIAAKMRAGRYPTAARRTRQPQVG